MFLLYLAVWFILNARFTWEILLFGLAVSAIAYWFSCRYLGFSVRRDIRLVSLAGLFAAYGAVLLWEICKANLAVLPFVLLPHKKPQPTLTRFTSGLRNPLTRVLLANSITLTPGTITVTLEEDEFCVHCLDRGFVSGIGEGTILQILQKMDRKLGKEAAK